MMTTGTAEEVSDDVLWLLADHQGTIHDVVDSFGTLRKEIDYDSFGQLTGEAFYDRQGAAIADPATHAEAVDQLFYYTGREWDAEAQAYNYRARWYDPTVGRFLSEDPSGLAGGDANLYRYVGNSPLNFTDPTGRRLRTPTDALLGFGGGGVDLSAVAPALRDFRIDATPRATASPGVSLSAIGSLLGNTAYTVASNSVSSATRSVFNAGITLGAAASSMFQLGSANRGASGSRGTESLTESPYVRQIVPGVSIPAQRLEDLPIRVQQAQNNPNRYMVTSHEGLGYHILDTQTGSVKFVANDEVLPTTTLVVQTKNDARNAASQARALTAAQEALISLSTIHETARDVGIAGFGYDYAEPDRQFTPYDRATAAFFLVLPGGNSGEIRTGDELIDTLQGVRRLRSPDPRVRPGYNPGTIQLDHPVADVFGGTATRPVPAGLNLRKGGLEGELRKYENYLVRNGMKPEVAREVIASEIESLSRDVIAAPFSSVYPRGFPVNDLDQ